MKKVLPIIIVLLIVVPFVVYMYVQMNPKEHSYPTNDITTSGSTPSPTLAPKQEQLMQKDSAAYKPLALTVNSPKDKSTVTSPSVTVSGTTAALSEVFVNDLETNANASGNFSVALTLDEGDNYIIVIANDVAGNFVEKELTVTYDSGQ